jgi:hypothetical protein
MIKPTITLVALAAAFVLVGCATAGDYYSFRVTSPCTTAYSYSSSYGGHYSSYRSGHHHHYTRPHNYRHTRSHHPHYNSRPSHNYSYSYSARPHHSYSYSSGYRPAYTCNSTRFSYHY